MTLPASRNPLPRLMLQSPRLTVASAESLTCGRVQAMIGAASGASGYFLGGITAYTLEQKVRHLGVNRRGAKRVNSVSDEVARQMARGACKLFGSDVAVATTGYAEPSPAWNVEEPFAWWAIAHRHRGRFIAVRSGRVEHPGLTRRQTQGLVAKVALAELTAYVAAWRAASVARKPRAKGPR